MDVLSKDEQIVVLYNRLRAANAHITTLERQALQLESQLANIQTKVLPAMRARLTDALNGSSTRVPETSSDSNDTFPTSPIDKKNILELLAGACTLLDNICGDLRRPGCEPRTDMGKVREFLSTVSGSGEVFEKVKGRVAVLKEGRFGMRDIFQR